MHLQLLSCSSGQPHLYVAKTSCNGMAIVSVTIISHHQRGQHFILTIAGLRQEEARGVPEYSQSCQFWAMYMWYGWLSPQANKAGEVRLSSTPQRVAGPSRRTVKVPALGHAPCHSVLAQLLDGTTSCIFACTLQMHISVCTQAVHLQQVLFA